MAETEPQPQPTEVPEPTEVTVTNDASLDYGDQWVEQ